MLKEILARIEQLEKLPDKTVMHNVVELATLHQLKELYKTEVKEEVILKAKPTRKKREIKK